MTLFTKFNLLEDIIETKYIELTSSKLMCNTKKQSNEMRPMLASLILGVFLLVLY